MRIFNNSKNISEWVFQGGDFNSFAHVRDFRISFGPGGQQSLMRLFNISNAPIGDGIIAFGNILAVWIKSEFKPADAKTDIKRLVKIRPETQNLRIPLFGPG